MSIKDHIIKRRTTHHYKPIPIDESIIDEALALVVHAPNHHLTFPYHFYKVKGQVRDNLLAYAYDSFAQKSQETADQKLKKWSSIPGWLLVTQKRSQVDKTAREDYATISIAMYILMLALDEKDIGAKWSTASLFETEEWYRICGINAEEEIIIGMLWYGYADKAPKFFERPNIEKYSSILE
ncbi:nitroreductase family protein [Wohlfahrtiimonas larvae]|uniref:Nitroreductase domain-containing protein n=1 Tax=Wohlfahrtiimonas larvae TaxID=1157986 RepID=A0ABP9MJ07_9GAMM|nr:nitroreductase family protein [Wohlfahrtiimonas larvae]